MHYNFSADNEIRFLQSVLSRYVHLGRLEDSNLSVDFEVCKRINDDQTQWLQRPLAILGSVDDECNATSKTSHLVFFDPREFNRSS